MPKPHGVTIRRCIRLPLEAYRQGDVFHLTICASDGTRPFAVPSAATVIARRLDAGLLIDGGPVVAYCVMPDHLHVVIGGAPDVVAWVRTFKAVSSAELRKLGLDAPIWQRGFHDRLLRREGDTIERVVSYVLENPVRAGFVERWEDWPYSRTAWDVVGNARRRGQQ